MRGLALGSLSASICECWVEGLGVRDWPYSFVLEFCMHCLVCPRRLRELCGGAPANGKGCGGGVGATGW